MSVLIPDSTLPTYGSGLELSQRIPAPAILFISGEQHEGLFTVMNNIWHVSVITLIAIYLNLIVVF